MYCLVHRLDENTFQIDLDKFVPGTKVVSTHEFQKNSLSVFSPTPIIYDIHDVRL